MVTPHVGRRLAVLRRRRGLSQGALAGLIGRSESWLSQVERGVRDLDSVSVLIELSRVLRVDLGQLVPEASSRDSKGRSVADPYGIVAIERAMVLATPAEGDGLPSLTDEVAQGHIDYQGARYTTVSRRLPGLLTRLASANPGPPVSEGYVLTAKLLNKLGSFELALVAADRARAMASWLGDAVGVKLAEYQVAAALIATDRAELLEIERVAPSVLTGNVVAQGVLTQLLTRSRGSAATAVRGLATRCGLLA